MPNQYTLFKSLLNQSPTYRGEITSLDGEAAVVTLPGGGIVVCHGTGNIGDQVFIKDHVILGPASTLTPSTIEI